MQRATYCSYYSRGVKHAARGLKPAHHRHKGTIWSCPLLQVIVFYCVPAPARFKSNWAEFDTPVLQCVCVCIEQTRTSSFLLT